MESLDESSEMRLWRHMGRKKNEVQLNYHIRFNPENDHHSAAAEYMVTVRDKNKTAFIAAAIETYRQAHPHGIDYEELEEIQKKSWRSFQPKVPILENMRNRKAPVIPAVSPVEVIALEDSAVDEAIDHALDHYDVL